MICSRTGDARGFAAQPGLDPAAPWIDLIHPDDDERRGAERALGLPLPDRDDQDEIEQSSRLYHAEGGSVMTALLPFEDDEGVLSTAPVSFALTPRRLATIRHRPHRAFQGFCDAPARASVAPDTPAGILVGLLESVVDRLADITEQTGQGIERMTRAVFRLGGDARRDHDADLRRIGGLDSGVAQLRESLLSMERLLAFLRPALADEAAARAIRNAQRDVRTISDQANFLTSKTAMLLDAKLGMISIEQNDIAKIFSIVATVFLPPTLIASVFGMNFAAMPLLEWRWGFALCMALMIATALVPLVWFRRKGWL